MAGHENMEIIPGSTLTSMLGDSNRIEIPIIQRDYAQGRASAKEILDEFINDLFNHLEQKEKIKLGFVYGAITSNVYIPYDGQQRITLIFLISLYCAAVCNEWDEIRKLSRLKYYTRDYATEFCDFLTSFKPEKRGDDKDNVFKRINLFEPKLVSQIKEDVEFFGAWEFDPTASSMMSVLEAIHTEFFRRYSKKNQEDRKNIAKEMLKSLKEGYVFFDWCRIKSSDNIYIKMNGRGKPLSAFDNFKNTLYAELERLREIDTNIDREDRISFLKNFEIKMDGVWTDLFWNLRNRLGRNENETKKDETYDIAPFMMNFLFYVFELKFAEKSTTFYFGGRMPFSWIDEKNAISFLANFKENCKGKNKKGDVSLDDYIWLSKILDILVCRFGDSRIDTPTPGFGNTLKSEYDLIDSISTSKNRKKTDTRFILSAQDSIVTAMYFEYLVHVSSFDLNGNLLACDDVNLGQWIKMIGRIVKTVGHYKGRYDALQRDKHVFQGFIDFFIPTVFGNNADGDLINAAKDFDEGILNELEKTFDASHAFSQLREEILKFKLISEDRAKWMERIRTAEENLPYFGNQLFFLFELSLNSDGKVDEKIFDSYLKILQGIMTDTGIRKDVQNVFTAILLYYGDYRISCGEGYGNAQGLCSNDSNENFQWRHFFDILAGDNKETRFHVMKKTFELIERKGSLENAYEEIKSLTTEEIWRDVIIKYPEVLDYGSKHRIVFLGDDGCWYLIRSNGVSKQVHSTSLFDSVSLELYGIYRESGFPDKDNIVKNSKLVLDDNSYIQKMDNGNYLYCSEDDQCELGYKSMIDYLKDRRGL